MFHTILIFQKCTSGNHEISHMNQEMLLWNICTYSGHTLVDMPLQTKFGGTSSEHWITPVMLFLQGIDTFHPIVKGQSPLQRVFCSWTFPSLQYPFPKHKNIFKNVYTSPYLKRYLPLVSLKHLPSGEQQTSVLLGSNLFTVKELLPQVQFLPSFKHTSPHKSTSLGPSQACLTSLDDRLSPIKVIRIKRTDDTRKCFISKLGISSLTINLISNVSFILFS